MGRFTGALNLVKDKKLPIAATIAGGASLGTSEESEAGFLSAAKAFLDSKGADLGISFDYTKLNPKATSENFKKARSLAEQNMSGKQIFEETGFFRGADGEWRFEIPDYTKTGKTSEDPQYIKESNPGKDGKPVRIKLKGFEDETLEPIEEAQSMFEYHAGNPPVKYEDLSGSGYWGLYSPGDKYGHVSPSITVSSDISPTKQQSILQHELQHGVQDQAGLARGANPDYIKSEISSGILHARSPLKADAHLNDLMFQGVVALSKLDRLSYFKKMAHSGNLTGKRRLLVGNSEWYEHSDKIRSKLGPEPKKHRPKAEREEWLEKAWSELAAITEAGIGEYEFKQLFDLANVPPGKVGSFFKEGPIMFFHQMGKDVPGIVKRADLAREMLLKDPSIASKQIARIQRAREGKISQASREHKRLGLLRDELLDTNPRELYRRSAGEVEARNVQARLGMPMEERLGSYPPLTEDVPRSEQILNKNITKGVYMGSADPKLLGALAGGSSLAAGGLLMSNDEASKSKTPKVDFLSKEEKQAFADKLKLRETGEIMALDYPSLYNLGRTLNKFDTPFGNPIGGVADLLEHLGTGGIDSKSRYSETGIPRYDLTGKKGLWAALDFL